MAIAGMKDSDRDKIITLIRHIEDYWRRPDACADESQCGMLNIFKILVADEAPFFTKQDVRSNK